MARAPVPSVAEFRLLSARPEAFPDTMDPAISATLAVWTDKVASFAGKHTRRVIVAWDGSLVLAVVDCAGFDLMTHRGFKKDQGADTAIQARRDKAMEWLGQVAQGEVEPFVDDGANYDDDGPRGGSSKNADDWTRYDTDCGCT